MGTRVAIFTMLVLVLTVAAPGARPPVRIDGYVGFIGSSPPIPYDGARVSVAHLTTGRTWSVTTDVDGLFSLDAEKAGIVVFATQVPGFEDALTYRYVGPQGASVTIGLELALNAQFDPWPLTSIELVDAAGTRVRNARVKAISLQAQTHLASGVTDNRGRFTGPCVISVGSSAVVIEVPGVAPYAVRAGCDTRDRPRRVTLPVNVPKPVASAPGRPHHGDRAEDHPNRIVLPIQILTDRGEPARGVVVSFSKRTGEFLQVSADDKGAIAATPMHAAADAWVIDHPGYAPVLRWRFESGSERVTLRRLDGADTEPWSLHGQLLSPDGTPVAHADVYAHPLDTLGIASQGKTDGAGHFRIDMPACSSALLIGMGHRASAVTSVPCADAASTPVILRQTRES